MRAAVKYLILSLLAIVICSCTNEEHPQSSEPAEERSYTIKSLGTASGYVDGEVKSVELLG